MIRLIIQLSSILFQLFIALLSANSQNTVLTGFIVGENTHEKIEFANVILLNKDSTYHSGCSTDSIGKFYFNNVKPDTYLIKVSYIGYLQKFKEYSLTNGTNNLGEIFLKKDSSMLNEAVVSATRLKYKTENGKTITNVSNTDLKTIGSAYDVLENVPGLTLIDEKINVFGKGEPIIYINNRKILNKKELEKYRSSDIKNIELIHNPSAKYDADGRSVLVINLNKNNNDHASFQATSQYRQGRYANTSDLVNFSLRKNKINIFSSYRYSYLKNDVDNTTNYTIYSNDIWLQEMSAPMDFQRNYHSVTAGMDWDLSKKHVIGAQYQGSFFLMKTNINGYQDLFSNNLLVDNINIKTNHKNESNQHLLNFFYDGNLLEKLKVTIIGDYLNNTEPSKQNTEETSLNSEERILNIDSYSKFEMIALKATASYNLRSNSTIELGFDYNKIDGNGYFIDDKNYLEKNVYNTTETKNGLFISFNDQIKNLNYNLGIRYEYSKYFTNENNDNKLDMKRHNFFPYLSISYKLYDISMSLSLSKKIRRPSFSELNSNNLYINKYLIQKGDPNLKAEDIYTINYLLGYKIFNFNLGYTYINNPICTDFVQETSSSPKSLMRFKNYNDFQKIDFFSTVNYSFGFWKFAYSLGFTQPFFKANYLNNISKWNKANLFLSLNNDFKLFGDFITSINFSINTDHNSYIMESKSQKRIDIRFRKPFFSNRLTASINIRDVFNWEKERNIVYIDNFNYDERRNRYNRYIAITLQFNISNSKSKYRGANVSTEDLKRF